MNKMLEMPEEARPVTLNARCRDCIHFHQQALFSDGRGSRLPCSALGRQERSLPCQSFAANPFGFKALKDDNLKALYGILGRLNRQDTQLLAALIAQEGRTAVQGFRFGEIAYIRMLPDDYLSNYASGRVIKADPDHVYLQGGRDGGYHATVLRSSVLKTPEWVARRADLVAKGRLIDPRAEEYYRVREVRDRLTAPDYTPPTLEDFQGAGMTGLAEESPVRESGRRRENRPFSAGQQFAQSISRLQERRQKPGVVRVAQG